MSQHVQLELPTLSRTGTVRAPKKTGTAATATAAAGLPTSAGRRQLGRRACSLASEILGWQPAAELIQRLRDGDAEAPTEIVTEWGHEHPVPADVVDPEASGE